jgi:hypothetical protein
MGAYFLLSLVVGPALLVRIGTGALSGLVGWAFSAFLAWRVTRGGRISRTLLIVGAGAGLIDGVIAWAIGFSWAELGLPAACAAQVALLLSPAVYQRTRPADQGRGSVALWRRRRPAPLAAALMAGAVLGLTGAAASAAVISIRVRGYHSDTVRVLAGHPARVTLAPGRYGAFGGCADEWGCAQLAPRDLTFTVPVREAVRIALNVNPRQPVLIAPSPEEAGLIHGEVVAVTSCGVLLLGSLAVLAWPGAPRARRRAA